MYEVREFSFGATVAAGEIESCTESSCVLHFKIYRYPKTLHTSKMQISLCTVHRSVYIFSWQAF